MARSRSGRASAVDGLSRTERERAEAAARALETSGIPRVLAAFNPLPVDSIRAGLDLPDSDVDVVCGYRTRLELLVALAPLLDRWSDGSVRVDGGVVVARTRANGFDVELYAAPGASADQPAARHSRVACRLASLGGAPFREAVRALKRTGAKTEPAIAAVLRLEGDPYDAVARLDGVDDAVCRALLGAARSKTVRYDLGRSVGRSVERASRRGDRDVQ